jgi:hypothetical protein
MKREAGLGAQVIVGRVKELAGLGEFLSGIEAGPIALVLDGEMGTGKTALWKAGLEAAADRSYRVLVCRPIESEAQLAHAALGELAEVSEEAMAGLPGPQRQALEVALLRVEPEGEPSQRAVALATLGVLRALARERPTVVGIDDVQWLDQGSESALAFVARRLKDDRIGLLVTRRSDGSCALPLISGGHSWTAARAPCRSGRSGRES